MGKNDGSKTHRSSDEGTIFVATSMKYSRPENYSAESSRHPRHNPRL